MEKSHFLRYTQINTAAAIILQAYIIKVAKLSSSSQVASKFKRTPKKCQNSHKKRFQICDL